MSKLRLTSQAPGIIGLFNDFPETAKALSAMAQAVLRQDYPGVTLPAWKREYIAAVVSQHNMTEFCRDSHFGAALACSPYDTIGKMQAAAIEDVNFQYLLRYCRAVALSPRDIDDLWIRGLEAHGWSKANIHIATLIACAFCMFNRYVTVLGNPPSANPDDYISRGEVLCRKGYHHR